MHIKGEGRGYFLLRRLMRSISSLWRIMSSICLDDSGVGFVVYLFGGDVELFSMVAVVRVEGGGSVGFLFLGLTGVFLYTLGYFLAR